MGKVNTSGAGAAQRIVITPGGPRPAENVHLIEPGYHVSGKNGVLRKIHTASDQVIREFGPVNADKTRSRKTLRSQRQAVAPGPITDQWIVYGGWINNSGNPINYFGTQWQIPPPPASMDNQLLYLFNGMEDAGYTVILQPVLQWGASPIGGGNYWAIANWYVGSPDSGLALHSPLVPVNPGDLITGVMTLTGQSNGAFSYLSSFAGYNADLPVKDIGELIWAVQTLECTGSSNFRIIRQHQ
jgi:hypothetical protein